MGRGRLGVGMEKKKKGRWPRNWAIQVRKMFFEKKKKREKKNWGVHFQLVGGYSWKHA